ncbi:unnamed protein product [Rotaria sp. Silwood2]|nr:unnamed protein product [Rotaria sp. Silwood2]
MHTSLRILLVTIICHCNPANPLQLFEDFKENMIEDFIQQGNSVEKVLKLCVNNIRTQIQQDGFDFNQFLPLPNFEDILDHEDNLINCIVNSNHLSWNDLNTDQLLAADTILKSIVGLNSQKCFYLDGPGESGKTFLYRTLIQKVNLIDLSTVKFPRLTQAKKGFLKSIDLLIWDEARMAPDTALEIVDLIFQDVMGV